VPGASSLKPNVWIFGCSHDSSVRTVIATLPASYHFLVTRIRMLGTGGGSQVVIAKPDPLLPARMRLTSRAKQTHESSQSGRRGHVAKGTPVPRATTGLRLPNVQTTSSYHHAVRQTFVVEKPLLGTAWGRGRATARIGIPISVPMPGRPRHAPALRRQESGSNGRDIPSTSPLVAHENCDK
jgi:hypothetical protein